MGSTTRSTGARSYQTSSRSTCIFQWDPPNVLVEVKEKVYTPYSKANKANDIYLEDSIAVFASKTLTANKESTYAMKPFSSFIRTYGKMHGLYISEDNDHFVLHSIFPSQKDASAVADCLEIEVIIMTSIRDPEIDVEMTRRELDNKGHHRVFENNAPF